VAFILERANKVSRTIDVKEQPFEVLFAIVDDIKPNVVGSEDMYVFQI